MAGKKKGFISIMIASLDRILEKKSKEKKTCGCNRGRKSCCK